MSVCFRGAPTSWTVRTTTATDLASVAVGRGRSDAPYAGWGLLLLSLVALSLAHAQDVRTRTRPRKPGTKVSESQAVDLTLTLSQASVRPIQMWVRTAGTIDKNLKVLTAYLDPPDAELVKVGQRVRSFPPASKSSMYQAGVTRVVPQGSRVMLEATLSASGLADSRYYVMEIVVNRGEFLSIPNEAIIEEGEKHIVYVQNQPGQYTPHEIQTGVQGELYTQVLKGLTEGDQVVTFGSFFIDSEYKLKGTEQAPMASQPSRRP